MRHHGAGRPLTVVVCEDADLALAVKATGAVKFRKAGQVRLSPTWFLGHNMAMAKVTEHAISKGATVETGGEGTGTIGNFFMPTVLNNVPLHADVFNNEPVWPFQRFVDLTRLTKL